MGRGIDIPWIGGIKISWVGGSIYPWYFDLTTHGKCIWTNHCARNKPFSTRTEELSTVECLCPVSVKQQFLTIF
jgi:hypothetical protein